MKRALFLIILALIITGIVAAQARKGGTMYVAVKTLTLKSGTGAFASNKDTINYGDRVTILQINGNFAEVQSTEKTSITGWTQLANLSAKQIVSGNAANVSTRETAMAGKGFNQEVEASYKSQNRNLNYADVDKVEAITVSEADLKGFLEEGRLRMGE